MSYEEYPFNFADLSKGDQISPEQIEEITGRTRGTDRYRLACLGLCKRIERECEYRGKHFTVVQIRDSIRILTDEEASRYNARLFRSGFRRSSRSFVRLTHVDTAKLTEAEKQSHERQVCVLGSMLQAARKAKADILPKPTVRNTPGLPHANGQS